MYMYIIYENSCISLASNRRRQTHTTNKQAATMASLSTATKGLENIRAATLA